MTIHIPAFILWMLGWFFTVCLFYRIGYFDGEVDGRDDGYTQGEKFMELKIRQGNLEIDGKKVRME